MKDLFLLFSELFGVMSWNSVLLIANHSSQVINKQNLRIYTDVSGKSIIIAY